MQKLSLFNTFRKKLLFTVVLIFTLNTQCLAQTQVSVSGVVTRQNGNGLGGVSVSLVSTQSNTVYVTITNPFGYYQFDTAYAGFTYVVAVSHKTYTFNPNVLCINVVDNTTNVNFTSDQ